MIKKYKIYDQVEGAYREAETYQEALTVQNMILSAYLESIRHTFGITCMVKNDDESWTQWPYDQSGEPIIERTVVPQIDVTNLGEQNG